MPQESLPTEPPVEPTTKLSIDGYFVDGPNGGCSLQELPPLEQIKKVVTEVDRILALRKKGPPAEQNQTVC